MSNDGMTSADISMVSKRLADATEIGSVCDWVERIAGHARNVGLSMARIHWNQCPIAVAFSVADEAYKQCVLAELLYSVENGYCKQS